MKFGFYSNGIGEIKNNYVHIPKLYLQPHTITIPYELLFRKFVQVL